MKTLEIHGSSGKSTLLLGESLKNLKTRLPPSKTVIITDGNVRRLYGDHFPQSLIIEIGHGEGVKTLETARDIFQDLVDHEAGRNIFIVGIGGGIVCDMAGFVASTYMRGVRFGFVATTLLAQVDASVGGKNGVNFSGFKNMVGVFNQPEFVICDPRVLGTLPERDRGCGLAEVVKHAAIADERLLNYLERNREEILAMSPGAVQRMVHDSVVIKSGIVNRDEKEKGERRKLNFGHTIGHAVEKVHGLPHGEAVSIGMMAAAKLSAKRRYLTRAHVTRLGNLLESLELPTHLSVDGSEILDALRRDKKRDEDVVHFVLLASLGRAVIEPIPLRELHGMIRELF